MSSKEAILTEFELFTLGTGGIGSWLGPDTDPEVFERLGTLPHTALTKVQLNQLLVLGREAPVSDGFFRYYFLEAPPLHPYNVKHVPGFETQWLDGDAIRSLAHLRWGLYRLFTDGLIWFGNVRTAFRQLRDMTETELRGLFQTRRFDTEQIKKRGPALPLKEIAKDDRYLISEMACKSYGDGSSSASQLREALVAAYKTHLERGGGPVKVKDLLGKEALAAQHAPLQYQLSFSADDILEETISSEAELEQKYGNIASKFVTARDRALQNTRYYLSMVSDLDVYVATSMRNRKDFRDMAIACDTIFGARRLAELNLRYFDPTMSAASGHEDKGLIECLMVKCAKVLVYCAGEKESYGKDAEAAMALSLGKPVIFYCTESQKSSFYKEVHPLSRLIEFKTGVPVGAMVTDKLEEVSELLVRLFENDMRFRLEHVKRGYLRLREELTGSVVRLQTSDQLLAETFWNHYHQKTM
jgi:hypothetical protein